MPRPGYTQILKVKLSEVCILNPPDDKVVMSWWHHPFLFVCLDQYIIFGTEEGIYTLNLNELHEATMEQVTFGVLNTQTWGHFEARTFGVRGMVRIRG